MDNRDYFTELELKLDGWTVATPFLIKEQIDTLVEEGERENRIARANKTTGSLSRKRLSDKKFDAEMRALFHYDINTKLFYPLSLRENK